MPGLVWPVCPNRALAAVERLAGAVQRERGVNPTTQAGNFSRGVELEDVRPVVPQLLDMAVHDVVVERIRARNIAYTQHWSDTPRLRYCIQHLVEYRERLRRGIRQVD